MTNIYGKYSPQGRAPGGVPGRAPPCAERPSAAEGAVGGQAPLRQQQGMGDIVVSLLLWPDKNMLCFKLICIDMFLLQVC